jgi:hypothetical protein
MELPVSESTELPDGLKEVAQDALKLYTTVRQGMRSQGVDWACRGEGAVRALHAPHLQGCKLTSWSPLKGRSSRRPRVMQGDNQELLRILQARYAPDATFTDHLVAARSRDSIGLQFYALHRLAMQMAQALHELRQITAG